MIEVSLFQFSLSEIYPSSLAFNVLIFSIALAVVSLFIWYFYRSISKRNLINLDLDQYNTSDHPFFSKLFALLLYLVEYIIVMPLLIVLWFAGLSIVLLVIAKERPTHEILLIAAAIIGAVRILAYFHGEISKDLAKLFPFITLSVFLLSPGELNYEQMLSKVYEIPALFNNILSFVLVVLLIEVVLRLFYSIFLFWASEGGEEEARMALAKQSIKSEEDN